MNESENESRVNPKKGVAHYTLIVGLLTAMVVLSTAVIVLSTEILKSRPLWKQLWQPAVGQAPEAEPYSPTPVSVAGPPRIRATPTVSVIPSEPEPPRLPSRKSCQLNKVSVSRGNQNISPVIVVELVDAAGPLAGRTIDVYELSESSERVRLASLPTGETGILTLSLPKWDGVTTLLIQFAGDEQYAATSVSIAPD